ncbi:MAG TPA: GAF domain-containing sensor histidine kinase [Bryobacterales bacterium]|jgi:signal transduction histidine kinase|nr:GAF domain-containing sensor histidine kinase [Bryobacterales bacterium]
MRGLERTPVLPEDAVVLSDQVQDYIRRLAERIAPCSQQIENRWRRRLARSGLRGNDPRLRALAAINPGAAADLLAAGNLADFFERVEYNGRRLAKLDVPPTHVISSLREYEDALLPDLRRFFPKDYSNYLWSLDHLYFCILLTLNTAYFQVRDLEAQAFFDLFQDELESLSVDDLLNRVLDSLMRTFNAQGGVVLLLLPQQNELMVKACRGLDPALARHFNVRVGEGFAGRIAETGKPQVVLDARADPLIRSSEVRRAIRSLWGVPLIVKGKVTGVLHLDFTREYNCLPREMKLLEAVAERCALALEKAQLMETLAQREEQIRQLGEHMLKVEEEERRRISRELHDEVGQAMLVVRLYLEMLQQEMTRHVPHLATKVEDALKVIDGTIRDMRRLISALSPNVLEQLGLAAALRQFTNNFGRNFPIHVRLKLSRLGQLPQDTEIMLYRLVQECFTNVIKHSKAENVLLAVNRSNGRLHVHVEDDGIGFDLEQVAHKRESFGISGMRERVALLGGKMEIKTRQMKGTKIDIQIPI